MTPEEFQELIRQEIRKLIKEEPITEMDFGFEDQDEKPYEGGDFDDVDFHTSAKDAAKKDIEDEGGSFEDIGTNKYEKGKTEKDFAEKVKVANLRLPSQEAEIEKISKGMETNKKEKEKLNKVGSKFGGTNISLNEDGEEGENYMTPQNLNNIKGDAEYLLTKIDSKGKIEDWIEDKISKVAENMRSVSYYYKGKNKEELNIDTLDEAKRNKQLIGIIKEDEEYDFDTTNLYKFLKDALYQLKDEDYAQAAKILEQELNKTFQIRKK